MSTNPNRVAWISQAPMPLCHIPWTGTVVVLADGGVNFCCHSEAVVGNVNVQTFEEVWNGPIMTAIRQDLAAQKFPSQCQSKSCPLYRGDRLTYLATELEPHGIQATGTDDPHAELRSRLEGTGIRKADGDAPRILLNLVYRGKKMWADLFVALKSPDGVIRFLPSMEEFALPFRRTVELSDGQKVIDIAIPAGISGPYEVSAAFFEPGTDPNRVSNCYWSQIIAAEFREPAASI
ncbi:MAG TPA: SPASM domain-containing protein [Candidatus Sulfopaludibacter sp.]|jgi:hypothetical protein|nr:SPASM domain-containing protein [Candidatus Sulfopaludibacter sp.]